MTTMVYEKNQNKLILEGEINFQNVTEFCCDGEKIFGNLDKSHIAIDLAKLSHHNHVVLTLLIAWKRKLAQLKKTSEIMGAHENLVRIAKICGVEKLLELQPSEIKLTDHG